MPFLLLIFALPLSAMEIKGVSTIQKTAFIFYKMTGLTPDYDRWVESMTKREVGKYGELGKREYLLDLRMRLESQFEMTNPDRETLVISHPAILEAVPVDRDNPDQRYINIYFEESPPFFSKRLPDRNIQIIVPDLEEKLNMFISGEEYERMSSLFYDGIKDKNLVTLKLMLKPVAADADKPIEKDNTNFYLFLTELQDFEIYNEIARDRVWPLPELQPTPEEIKEQEDKEMLDDFMNKYK